LAFVQKGDVLKIFISLLFVFATCVASAKAVDRIVGRFALFRSQCHQAEGQLKEKLARYSAERTGRNDSFYIWSRWAPGSWAGGDGFWDDSHDVISNPHYRDPTCEVFIETKSSKFGFEKKYSQKIKGSNRGHSCETMANEVEARSESLMTRIFSGGVFKRYCQVSYYQVVDKN